jgi:uncharacterized membrane protein YraQ (UPF0718 family)
MSPDAGPNRGRGKPTVFDGTFFSMLVLLGALAALAWYRGGSELLLEGLGSGGNLLLRFAALLIVAFLVAGIAEKLIPHDWVRAALGEDSGMRGLLIAVGAGMVTPSGPFISFPVAATLIKSGASTAAVVTYVAAWMLLAIHRFFIWEVPFLGLQTAVVRWAVCLVLPILAGLATRAVLR